MEVFDSREPDIPVSVGNRCGPLPGRWNRKGQEVVPATSRSLALVEILVHLPGRSSHRISCYNHPYPDELPCIRSRRRNSRSDRTVYLQALNRNNSVAICSGSPAGYGPVQHCRGMEPTDRPALSGFSQINLVASPFRWIPGCSDRLLFRTGPEGGKQISTHSTRHRTDATLTSTRPFASP